MSQNDWMLDVLVDLRSAATANGLGALADHLHETLVIAGAEMASLENNTGAQKNGEQTQHRQNPEDTGGDQYS